MKIAKQKIENQVKYFEQVCRNSNVKLTFQRIEIFREVIRTDDHPDAETIYKRVQNRIITISLDTVYRTLWLLNDLGLITTLGSARVRTRFDGNLSQHHHFICNSCGLTRDFYSDEFNSLKPPQSVKTFGRVETTNVEVQGICLKCADKKTRKEKDEKIDFHQKEKYKYDR
ncbi:Fur family transcriptional regulator [Candidatus Riflebacteria bacterium]